MIDLMWTYIFSFDDETDFYILKREGVTVGRVDEEYDAKAICEAMNNQEAVVKAWNEGILPMKLEIDRILLAK